MNKAYKFRLYPNKKQVELLNKCFGCNRFVYNFFLEKKVKAYKDEGVNLSYTKMANLLALMKREEEYAFLKEADSVSLQQSLRHLDTAFANFYKHKEVGFPRCKSKKSHHYSYSSICIHNNIKLLENKIQIPKVGEVKMVKHRHIPDNYILKSITVSKDPDDKYFVSILFEYENQVPKKIPTSFIGLDYSVNHLFVDSDHCIPFFPRCFADSQAKLEREQRKLSRMMKGSNNYHKQRIKIAKIHSHIANQRKDYLHNESRNIVRVYDCVVIEDLSMQDIVNKNEIQHLHFGKQVADNGWSLFVNMLDYKLKEQGKMLIEIDKYFPSSQKCSCCGSINKALKDFSIRKWTCPSCGQVHNRDVNAAINIREEGKRLFFDRYNRGTHGVSSPMLGSLWPSNEKPPLL